MSEATDNAAGERVGGNCALGRHDACLFDGYCRCACHATPDADDASEAVTDPDTGIVYFPDDPTPNPHASTGASEPLSEDMEALAKVIVGHQRIPMYGHIPGVQRCTGGCDALLAESDGPNSPRHAQHVAEQILASDWLAAREAAARAEGAAEALYQLGLWCGECDPADPDDDCCVVDHRVRPLLAARIARGESLMTEPHAAEKDATPGECLWANQICEPNHHGCLTCFAVEPNRPTPPGKAER